ncbi:MAG TPA: hypothetical protein VH540_03755 [Ktedonobacterales bacterium]|jgi:hypothetical protein
MRRLLPVFVLLLLAPAIPELLTGSTPLHTFFTPFSFILEVGLYGAGAILIHELARERGLGWPRILLLGAAYGIIEEGLQIQSFFNIHHPGIGNLAVYGRGLGVNWVWAEMLTFFHAVFSITIPILLTEMLFPSRRAQPWLGKVGRRVFGGIFALDVVLGTILFTAIWHTQYNYLPPLLPYVGCIALVVVLVWRALRPVAPARPTAEVMIPQAQRPPPRLWVLRAFGFGGILGMYLISGILASDKSTIPAPITMLIEAGWAWFLYWRIRRWSGPRRVWNDRHKLALATGGMLLFALADVIIFGLAMHALDQLVVGLATIALLILLARRVNARAAKTLQAANAATDYLVPPPGGIPVYATNSDQLTVAFTGDPAQPPAPYPPDAPTIDLNRNPWSA